MAIRKGGGKNRTCRCKICQEERVDITPADCLKKRWFTRCRRCGVVLSAYCPGQSVLEKVVAWLRNKR